MDDLISRSALIAEHCDGCDAIANGLCDHDVCGAAQLIMEAPAVDAVELPKGRPGDYLEWDNGTGYRQIYSIHSVMICEECMRYELADFAPVVGHPGIVRILSREEVEKLAKERMEREKCVSVEAKMEG